MIYLDIGHGPKKFGPEWVNLSATKLPNTDVVCNWGVDNIPYKANTFDIIHSSHCLEHVPWYNVDIALKECYRVLKEGGKLEIWVPDFAYIVKCYLEDKCGDMWRKHNANGDPMRWMNGRMFAYSRSNEQNFHQAAYDRPYLEQCFREAGFKDVYKLETPRDNGHPIELQLGVGATK